MTVPTEPSVNQRSRVEEKIALFRTLFRTRMAVGFPEGGQRGCEPSDSDLLHHHQRRQRLNQLDVCGIH